MVLNLRAALRNFDRNIFTELVAMSDLCCDGLVEAKQNLIIRHLLYLGADSEVSRGDGGIAELDYRIIAITRNCHLIQSGDTWPLLAHGVIPVPDGHERTREIVVGGASVSKVRRQDCLQQDRQGEELASVTQSDRLAAGGVGGLDQSRFDGHGHPRVPPGAGYQGQNEWKEAKAEERGEGELLLRRPTGSDGTVSPTRHCELRQPRPGQLRQYHQTQARQDRVWRDLDLSYSAAILLVVTRRPWGLPYADGLVTAAEIRAQCGLAAGKAAKHHFSNTCEYRRNALMSPPLH